MSNKGHGEETKIVEQECVNFFFDNENLFIKYWVPLKLWHLKAMHWIKVLEK